MQRERNAPVSARQHVGALETCTWVLGQTLHITDATNGHLRSELLPDLHLEHFLMVSLQPRIPCVFFDGLLQVLRTYSSVSVEE